MALLRIPIFPLPLVLFPGTPQLLHIFEPRYRDMLDDCMDGDRKFGISWIDGKGVEDPSPEAGSVGCIAFVRARTGLPDGRSNILTMGEDRYVLRRYVATDRPYRVGEVETFDDDPKSGDETGDLCARVADDFRRFTVALSALNDATTTTTPELPGDPRALSFHIAAALEIETRAKQELLCLRSSRHRLEVLEGLLRSATEDLAPRAEIHVRSRRNGKGGPNAAIVRGT